MLKSTYSLVVFSAVCFSSYGQNDVRFTKTSNGTTQVREINNTSVPVIEKKDNQNQTSKNQGTKQATQPENKNTGVKKCCMGNGNVNKKQYPKQK